MTYGTIKVDTVTFTDAGVDKSVTLSGLVQNPTFSGNVTVTGTLSGVTVTGTTANFTSGNFTNISGGTHTITSGVFAAGSAASPSITFTGDLNTGIYSPGADQVAISTNSSGRLFIDANGHIGLTASASAWGDSANGSRAIQIGGSSWYNYRTSIVNFGHGYYYDASDNYRYVYTGVPVSFSQQTAGEHRWFGASSGTAGNSFTPLERMRLDSSGRLGVGTSSPGVPLEVSATTPIVRVSLSSDSTKFGNFYHSAGTTAISSRNGASNGSIAFQRFDGTTTSTSVTIDPSGNVGVGTTSPSAQLHVQNSGGNSESILGQFGTGTQIKLGAYANEAIIYAANNASAALSFYTNSSERLRIDSSGRVGIGTSAPSSLLHLAATVPELKLSATGGATARLLADGSALYAGTSGAHDIRLETDGTTRLFIAKTSGNVGIGTTSPGRTLDVAGTIRSTTGVAELDNATQFKLLSFHHSGTRTGVVSYDNTNNWIYINAEAASSQMLFGTAGSERLRIDSSGRVGIGTSSPSTTLHVVGTGLFTGSTQFNNGIQLKAATQNYIYFDDALSFTRNGVGDRLTIDSSGRVGIGASSISEQLQLGQNGSGTDNYIGIWGDQSGSNGEFAGIKFFNNQANASATPVKQVASIYAARDGDNFGGALYFQTANTSSGSQTLGTRMLLDSSGRLGIGTTSPVVEFEVRKNYAGPTTIKIGNTNTGGSSGSVIQLENGTAGVDLTNISTSKAGSFFALQGFGSINTSYLDFNTHIFRNQGGSTEYARIDSSGRLLVGTSSARTTQHSIGGNNVYDVVANVQHERTGEAGGFSAVVNKNDASGAFLNLAKTRGSSVGSNTIVASEDVLGTIGFFGADGTDITSWGGAIQCFVDGTPGANDMPGRIVLSTTADGASSPTERMRIGQAGQATFTTTTSTPAIFVTNTDGAYADTINTWRSARAANTAYNFLLAQSSAGSDNEFALIGDGNGKCDGSWTGGGADYAEYFEWIDSNATAEDRRGISVVLDGDKIREALTGEDPIGVISGNPSVVGDAAWNKWSGKYLRDEFGTYIQEDYEVTDDDGNTVIQQRRKLNPAYDPHVEYISREQRPEWDCVGLMGKLRIRKGQVTGSRWIKMRDINDSVEEWLVR